MSRDKCRSCGASILWAKTAAGKAIPLDAEPRPDGNVRLLSDGSAEVLSKDDLDGVDMRAALEGHVARLYLSHFATCPNAKQHRKPRT